MAAVEWHRVVVLAASFLPFSKAVMYAVIGAAVAVSIVAVSSLSSRKSQKHDDAGDKEKK